VGRVGISLLFITLDYQQLEVFSTEPRLQSTRSKRVLSEKGFHQMGDVLAHEWLLAFMQMFNGYWNSCKCLMATGIHADV
jgi:hypothetical protein